MAVDNLVGGGNLVVVGNPVAVGNLVVAGNLVVVGNLIVADNLVVVGNLVAVVVDKGFPLGVDPLEIDLLIVLIGYEIVSQVRVSPLVVYLKIQQWNHRHIQSVLSQIGPTCQEHQPLNQQAHHQV